VDQGVLERLRKQHQWGDLNDDEYRRERSDIVVALASLPGDNQRLETFDRNRLLFSSVAESIAHATPELLAELVHMTVDRVDGRPRGLRHRLASGSLALPERQPLGV
jgi:hypothetical protein